MAFTGRGHGRRAFLHAAAAAAPLALGGARVARAADYQAAAQVFEAIERLEVDVDGRLAALQRAVPAVSAFVAGVQQDRARHRAERARMRRRLGVKSAVGMPEPFDGDASLEGLRGSQEALVHAHAEGLPALGNPQAVDRLAAHMVDLARQLTVIELWIEQEDARE